MLLEYRGRPCQIIGADNILVELTLTFHPFSKFTLTLRYIAAAVLLFVGHQLVELILPFILLFFWRTIFFHLLTLPPRFLLDRSNVTSGVLDGIVKAGLVS